MSHFTDPFRSARLFYRAVEPNDPADEAFFLTLQQDAKIFVNSNASIPRPQTKKDAQDYMKAVNESLCGAMMCLPPDESDKDGKPKPIGVIHLKKFADVISHHRFTEIGVEIHEDYQGKGYGSEAIYWILEWAFERAGIHRVAIRCFEYNEGARRLYEKLGFKLEGIVREEIWYCNRWWDGYCFGMLDREWAEIKAKRNEKKS